MTKDTVYKIVTERILELLDKGIVPWQRPWSGNTIPKNLISKKPYRGINVFLLGSQAFSSPYWLTFRQAKQLGGSVRKGEKSTIIVFWKWNDLERENPETGEAETVKVPLLRYYRVFNVGQCDNLDESKIPPTDTKPLDFQPIEACESIVGSFPQAPVVRHGGGQAYYHPSADYVQMPPKEVFLSKESYYLVLFHELTHATGHESRLKRFDSTKCAAFGTADYSKEELVAEMGAAFLAGVSGIQRDGLIENSAAYISNWCRKLKDNVRWVVLAAAQAQKAVDFIQGEN